MESLEETIQSPSSAKRSFETLSEGSSYTWEPEFSRSGFKKQHPSFVSEVDEALVDENWSFGSQYGSPPVKGKRWAESAVDESAAPFLKRPVLQFWDRPSSTKRPMESDEVSFEGFKRTKPEYWDEPELDHQPMVHNKRRSSLTLPWLHELATKKPKSSLRSSSDDDDSAAALAVYGPLPPSPDLDSAIRRLPKGSLSKVPKPLYVGPPPEGRIIVWSDPYETISESFPKFHPPMAWNGPRIEILDSDDDEDVDIEESNSNALVLFDGGAWHDVEDDGCIPMDMSE